MKEIEFWKLYSDSELEDGFYWCYLDHISDWLVIKVIKKKAFWPDGRRFDSAKQVLKAFKLPTDL